MSYLQAGKGEREVGLPGLRLVTCHSKSIRGLRIAEGRYFAAPSWLAMGVGQINIAEHNRAAGGIGRPLTRRGGRLAGAPSTLKAQ